MPSERVEDYLTHILTEIDFAEKFIGNLGPEEFAADPLTLRAVIRCLEVISKASRRLPLALKERHPDVPWQDIAGAGNIYRRDYDQVLTRRIWQTASSLSDLRDVVKQELAR